MPTYVYKFVDTGETIEVQQAFTDDSLTEYAHPESGDVLPVKKVFQPVGVTFKGSGFFKTDNRGSSATTPPGTSSDSSTGSGSSDSSSGSTSTTSDSGGSSSTSRSGSGSGSGSGSKSSDSSGSGSSKPSSSGSSTTSTSTSD